MLLTALTTIKSDNLADVVSRLGGVNNYTGRLARISFHSSANYAYSPEDAILR
jgi:hypothetical protein